MTGNSFMLMLVLLFLCAFSNHGQGLAKNLLNIYLNNPFSRFQLFFHFLVWLLSNLDSFYTFLRLMSRKLIFIRLMMMISFMYVRDLKLKTPIQNAHQTLLCSCSVVRCIQYVVFAIA